MTNVRYIGRSDARVLDGEDLAKGDVEGFTETVFPRNKVVEISEAAATAILRVPEIYGEFELVEDSVTKAEPVKGKAKGEAASSSASTDS